MGRTCGEDSGAPLRHACRGGPEGAVSADGRVAGTYLHGMFATDAFRAAWLGGFGVARSDIGFEATVEATLDALADHLEEALDVDGLLAVAR